MDYDWRKTEKRETAGELQCQQTWLKSWIFWLTLQARRLKLIQPVDCVYEPICLHLVQLRCVMAGKKRLWVITAPSHNDHYLRMMEKQLEDMDQVMS